MDANGISNIQKPKHHLAACEEQMHLLLFHKAYQGHATEWSNKSCPVIVPQTQHLFCALKLILRYVFLNRSKKFATLL